MVICKLDRRNCIFNDFTILLMDIQADHRYKERTAAANSTFASAGGHQSFLLTVLPATQKVVFSCKQKRVQYFGN